MKAGYWAIDITQGEAWDVTLTYQDTTGAYPDLSAFDARMQWRESYNSPAAVLDLSVANGGIILGSAGTIRFIATAAQTAPEILVVRDDGRIPATRVFVHDFKLSLGSAVIYLLQGPVTVAKRVTE